jgi:putative hemolysin
MALPMAAMSKRLGMVSLATAFAVRAGPYSMAMALTR